MVCPAQGQVVLPRCLLQEARPWPEPRAPRVMLQAAPAVSADGLNFKGCPTPSHSAVTAAEPPPSKPQASA